MLRQRSARCQRPGICVSDTPQPTKLHSYSPSEISPHVIGSLTRASWHQFFGFLNQFYRQPQSLRASYNVQLRLIVIGSTFKGKTMVGTAVTFFIGKNSVMAYSQCEMPRSYLRAVAACFSISIIALIVSLVNSPASAGPYAIHNLSHDALLGSTNSRLEMQQRVRQYDARVRKAASDLGLTPSQVQAFETQLPNSRYVVLPRHLNAMAGYAHGTPYVVHDVIIPVNSRGWEVDVVQGDSLMRVFVPAACGNLSILRSFQPHIAQLPERQPSRPVRAALLPATSVVAPSAPAAQPVPAPAVVPAAQPPAFAMSSPQVVSHHGHFPWWLALIAIPFIHGGGSSQAPGYHAPTPPPPPIVGCKP